MKKIGFLVCVFFAMPLLAHECWIACQKYYLKIGETARISFHVGENFEPEKWAGKIKWLKVFAPNKTEQDILPVLDTTNRTLSFLPKEEGTHLVALHSEAKFIRLEAAKFNSYLEEDGLADVLNFRKQNAQIDKEGTELYERCNKTLLQVGKQKTNAYKKIVGLPLEIVLLQNPYKNPSQITVKLLFKNKPLPLHLVKVWHRQDGKTTLQDLKTDAKGLLTFPLKKTGVYMISSVKMVANEKQPDGAQWHSYWANYTFGGA